MTSSNETLHLITQKLQNILKIKDVDILTEYVWHMLANKNATSSYMCTELKEFLEDNVESFVDWVFALVNKNQESHSDAAIKDAATVAEPTRKADAPSTTICSKQNEASKTAASITEGTHQKREHRRERIFSLAVLEATQKKDKPLGRSDTSRRLHTSDAVGDAKRRKSERASGVSTHQDTSAAPQEAKKPVILMERDARNDAVHGETQSNAAATTKTTVEEVKAVLTPNPRFISSHLSSFLKPSSSAASSTPEPVAAPAFANIEAAAAPAASIPVGNEMRQYDSSTQIFNWTNNGGSAVLDARPPDTPMTPFRAAKIKKRCANWPECPFDDQCHFIHPIEKCENWPNCNFGRECFYIHPDVACRYGTRCMNMYCNYSHHSTESKFNATKLSNKGLFKNKTLTFTGEKAQDDSDGMNMEAFNMKVEKISSTMPPTPPSMKPMPQPALDDAISSQPQNTLNELPQLQL